MYGSFHFGGNILCYLERELDKEYKLIYDSDSLTKKLFKKLIDNKSQNKNINFSKLKYRNFHWLSVLNKKNATFVYLVSKVRVYFLFFIFPS